MVRYGVGQSIPGEKNCKRIWASKAILKVKNFVWKATQNAIRLNLELARREVQISPTCPFCDNIATVSPAPLKYAWTRCVGFGVMEIRWVIQEEIEWDDWLKCLQDMHNIRGEQRQKRRVKGETMAWEIWKESVVLCVMKIDRGQRHLFV